MKRMKMMRTKKLVVVTLCITLLTTIFTGCGASTASSGSGGNIKNSATEKPIPILSGEWKQTNSKTDSSYQAATISGDTIEIYWVSNNGETKSLYWAGSYIAPTNTEEPYTWDSKNDHSKTDKSILASPDDTKTLTYQSGVLSYTTSAMGTTTTIRLEKQK